MSFLSSIGKMLKAIFKKLLSWVKKILKAIWPILLIIAIIYFAPMAVAWLTSVGAPSFLVTGMSAVSSLTPYVTTALSWLGTNAGALVSSAWSGYSSFGTGTQLAILGGAAAMIAPEEFQEVIKEGAALAGDVIGTVAGAVAKGFAASPIGILAIGAGALWLIGSGDDKKQGASA